MRQAAFFHNLEALDVLEVELYDVVESSSEIDVSIRYVEVVEVFFRVGVNGRVGGSELSDSVLFTGWNIDSSDVDGG
jgi:hypothetical protein